jgi:hypothetical protein
MTRHTWRNQLEKHRWSGGCLRLQVINMRRSFLGFTFERESHWMVVWYLLVPLPAILFGIVIPGLWRRLLP